MPAAGDADNHARQRQQPEKPASALPDARSHGGHSPKIALGKKRRAGIIELAGSIYCNRSRSPSQLTDSGMLVRTKTPNLREHMLDAAARMFGNKRFDETRMDDIAAEANVSKGTLYRYF